jgi:hypothetical protein
LIVVLACSSVLAGEHAGPWLSIVLGVLIGAALLAVGVLRFRSIGTSPW